jgi:hypothetical protein
MANSNGTRAELNKRRGAGTNYSVQHTNKKKSTHVFTEKSDGVRADVSICENVLFFCVEAAVERAATKRSASE